VSEQSTYGDPATIGDQFAGVRAVAWLTESMSHLPAAYITIPSHSVASVRFGLRSTSDFEAWRAVFAVPAGLVEFHHYGVSSWLSMTVVVQGAEVMFAADVEVLPEFAVRTPVEDAEFQAALLVQRHELEDPAEPPLAWAEPAEPVAVRPLADMPGGAL
jgi:hypothetical protein